MEKRMKKRKELKKQRETTVRLVLAGLIAIMALLAACLLSGIATYGEIKESEKRSEEFDQMIQESNNQREASGQDATLEAAREWREQEKEKYAEIKESEKRSEEFDQMIQESNNQREASGQDATLEAAREWREQEKEKYAAFEAMSKDWGIEDVEGFAYYEIPEAYQNAGGYLPKEVQVYIYCLCRDYEVSFPLVLALIEKESGYVFDKPEAYQNAGGYLPKEVQVYIYCLCRDYEVSFPLVLALIEKESGYVFDKLGDDGNSYGYMQIYEKWHTDRMERLNCSDLTNPYQNVTVGIDYLSELLQKYGTEQDALTAYNYGEQGAREHLWSRGIYAYEYNQDILSRAEEIEIELQKIKGGAEE